MGIIKCQAALGIILNERNEVLLQKKDALYHWKPNHWGFFGGQIERNETPLEAFLRETNEEGLSKLYNFEFFRAYNFSEKSDLKGISREGVTHIFSCYFTSPLGEIRLQEGGGFAFFSIDEFNSIKIVPYNRIALDEFYKERIPSKL